MRTIKQHVQKHPQKPPLGHFNNRFHPNSIEFWKVAVRYQSQWCLMAALDRL